MRLSTRLATLLVSLATLVAALAPGVSSAQAQLPAACAPGSVPGIGGKCVSDLPGLVNPANPCWPDFVPGVGGKCVSDLPTVGPENPSDPCWPDFVPGVGGKCVSDTPGVGSAAAPGTHPLRFKTRDGTSLYASVAWGSSLAPRPTIVEFSPYGPSCCASYAGPAFNYVQVDIRGTGRSDGTFDSLGPHTQGDMVDFLKWACHQPWSNGSLGLYGASATAIAVYNTLDQPLPCVKTAVLWAGTDELYRDLLYPGGMPNLVPAAGVLGLITGPYAENLPGRAGRNPGSTVDNARGLGDAAAEYELHPTIDRYWRQRQRRGDVNHLPILMITGFFDVESRGPFQTFQALRRSGAHLMVVGAHDGSPAGTDGGAAERQRWYEHYLAGTDNGVQKDPTVQLLMADGGREQYLAGDYVRHDGDNWPIPHTRWAPLYLDPARSGTADSINDGSLGLTRPGASAKQSYPEIPSEPSASDPNSTSILFGLGAGPVSGNAIANRFPFLTQMNTAERLGLSYTTKPLARDLVSAGPADLDLRLSSTAVESDLFAVISDVWPDGTAHPMSVGRLRSSFPLVDRARSLTDPRTGAIVQPYGIFDHKTLTLPGRERLYHVEFWPIGNRFKQGHRLRLDIVGGSAYHQPGGAAVDSVRVGGITGSRLLLPVLPGSDIGQALPH